MISCPPPRPSFDASPPRIIMVPRTATQIARPLPPSRPIPPTPRRGIIYVVERFGRFSRLLPGNGPPLLPLVDRVIAAFAKRVDQATPPEGIVALLAASFRVIVNATWSIRVTDPRKLAYRVSDVDRCVDMLIHVRIRDTLSTLPANIDIQDPAILNRVSEAIRLGVDTTAARFGVSCPQFKIISIRMAEDKPQRSLNLAEAIHTSEYYANEIESVLPELPPDATRTATDSFASLLPVTQPAYINYPQPIAYPQPVQPVQPIRKQPALASVRLPPPQPTRQPSNSGTHQSDDDSLIQLHNSQQLPQSQSFRELPTTSPKEPDTDSVELSGNYARSRSLPQLIISEEDEPLAANKHSAELETQSSREIRSSDDETLRAAKSVLAMHTSEKASPVSEDASVTPLPPLPSNEGVQELLLQELPRDMSSLTDEIPPASLPEKREILYAPPPSPIASDRQASGSSVSPKTLSQALSSDIRKPSSDVDSELAPSSSERTLNPSQARSLPSEQTLPQVERVTPPEERPPPLLEQLLHTSEPESPPMQSTSPPVEQSSPPSETKLPTNTEVLQTADRGLPSSEQISSPTENLPASSPQISPSQERTLLTTELDGPPTERAVSSPEQTSGQTTKASRVPERARPDQFQSLGERERGSPVAPPSSSSGSVPEGFSPPLANIFRTATPTPPSELPASERGSDSSPSDTRDGPLRSPPVGSPVEHIVDRAALENPASESPAEFKDATDHPVPSPLMLNPVSRPPETMERDSQNFQLPPLVRSASNRQNAPTNRSRQAPTAPPLRAGMPLLGPPMIPDPREAFREHQPAYQTSTDAVRGLQTAARGMAPQGYLSPSLPPRAPTPPMMPLSPPGYSPTIAQYGAGPSVQTSPVMAEGLGIGSASPGRPLPMGVGATHSAEVGGRVKRAIPRPGHQQVDGTSSRGYVPGEDYPGMQYVQDNRLDSDSDDTNVATRSRFQKSSPLKQEPRKRRQNVQTSSLFSPVTGKPERTIKSTATSASSGQQTTTRSARTGLSMEQSQQKLESIHEGARVGVADTRHLTTNISQGTKANVDGLRGKEMLRSEAEYEKDDAHLRRDGKRMRTAEEEETLRTERTRRDRQMNEFDMTHRKSGGGLESSDDDSTRMMIDEGSDEERERFDEASMSGTHSRRRRQKTHSRRRHARRIDPTGNSDDSSSEETCTDCGHQHEGRGGSSSRRKGKSRSRSSRSDSSHYDRSDEESEPRSVSRSRSGRSRKGTSESSVDSHRSGRSSSRDQRSKKSSPRDRKIEKTSSSSRSRSRDGKRSHSKSRSSSRKRDEEDKKRKPSSKSKSRSRDKREVPTQEQLEYRSKRTGVKSIYRHRLPDSDSGPENPIPWYCEGQSQPEDTDLEDYEGPDSSGSEDEKRTKTTSTMYSSYGGRDRHGRRHRAHHKRNVTFLYDNRR